VQSYFLGGKYPDVRMAAKGRLLLEQYPLLERVELDQLAQSSGVAAGRHASSSCSSSDTASSGASGVRVGAAAEQADLRRLSADLTDYEARREQDRAKLRAMVSYARTHAAHALPSRILRGAIDDAWVCGNCDACDAQEM
jgi:ATP-dependent DNA helicase RecQ